MGFEFLSDDFEMRDGLDIDYRLRPLLGIPVTWRTGITSYDPPHRFTDVQLKGPYRQLGAHPHVPGGRRRDARLRHDRVPTAARARSATSPIGWWCEASWSASSDIGHVTIEGSLRDADTNPDAQTIAVAGGTGFVGGAIAAELRRRGHRVVVLSHRGEAARGQLPDDVEIVRADVTKPEGLTDALRGVDALVISLAFPNSPIEAPRKGRTFEPVDAQGTEHLVAAARPRVSAGLSTCPAPAPHRTPPTLVPGQVAGGGGRPGEWADLDHHPARPGSTGRATSRSTASSASPGACGWCP